MKRFFLSGACFLALAQGGALLVYGAGSNISVNFDPSYAEIPSPPQDPANRTGNIKVQFTPNYQPIPVNIPGNTESVINVNFTPNYAEAFSAQSPDEQLSVAYQGATLGGQSTPISLQQVTEPDSKAVLGLSAASQEDMAPIGNTFYDLGPDGTVFTPSAEIMFKYTEPLPDGVDESSLNVYRFDPATGWQLLPAMGRNTDENWILARTDTLCLFGIFYPGSPLLAPLVTVNGSTVPAGVTTQIQTSDAVKFEAGINYSRVIYSLDVDFSTQTALSYASPFSLTAGTHTLSYMAVNNAGNSSPINTVYLEVAGPQTQTALIEPSSGPIGMPFTITGTDFGAYSAGTTVVMFGDTPAPLTLWSTGTIKGTLPGALQQGEYPVTVKRGATVLGNAQAFIVTVPSLTSISPSSGAIGVPFVITGENFGNYVANHTTVLIGGATAPLTLWSDTAIRGTIPGTLAPGQYDLAVKRDINGGIVITTAPISFNLVSPNLLDMVPSSGAIGVGFTITGENFGNYAANNTRVLIGGTTCPLTLWTDTTIKGSVPGSLASGTYEVFIERELNGGIVRTSTASFMVIGPSVNSLTPSSGPIGMPFAINGSGFGNYVANYTRVLIGGATAPLTLWTDSKIEGTAPGTLSPGDYDLSVQRELNGGMVSAAPLPFSILASAISGVAPSSGPIGAPFTINGVNFGNYVANYTRVLIGGTTVPLTLWTDTNIQGMIPGNLTPGGYELAVERALNGGLTRSSQTFVVIAPVMSSVAPSSGPIGMPFTITGSGFGNYVANNTKVLIGGATAPLTLWTDTKIQGTVPGVLAPGDYDLYAERALNGGG